VGGASESVGYGELLCGDRIQQAHAAQGSVNGRRVVRWVFCFAANEEAQRARVVSSLLVIFSARPPPCLLPRPLNTQFKVRGPLLHGPRFIAIQLQQQHTSSAARQKQQRLTPLASNVGTAGCVP
jgi:hypothetical protein